MDRDERLRLEGERARLRGERSELAAQFARDKHSVLTLHTELNLGVRPLSDEWLQSGIELLLRLHQTSARLVDIDAQLTNYRKLL